MKRIIVWETGEDNPMRKFCLLAVMLWASLLKSARLQAGECLFFSNQVQSWSSWSSLLNHFLYVFSTFFKARFICYQFFPLSEFPIKLAEIIITVLFFVPWNHFLKIKLLIFCQKVLFLCVMLWISCISVILLILLCSNADTTSHCSHCLPYFQQGFWLRLHSFVIPL